MSVADRVASIVSLTLMFILPLESFKDLNTSELYSVRKIRLNSITKNYLHVVDQGISRLQVLPFAWAAQSRNKSDLKLPLRICDRDRGDGTLMDLIARAPTDVVRHF